MSDSLDDVISDALTTVRLVPRWSLSQEEWQGVADALRQLQGAIGGNDRKQVLRASEHLDSLYPPTRLSGIHPATASANRNPAPAEVLELVNTLIHPTGGWTPEAAASGADSSH